MLDFLRQWWRQNLYELYTVLTWTWTCSLASKALWNSQDESTMSRKWILPLRGSCSALMMSIRELSNECMFKLSYILDRSCDRQSWGTCQYVQYRCNVYGNYGTARSALMQFGANRHCLCGTPVRRSPLNPWILRQTEFTLRIRRRWNVVCRAVTSGINQAALC